MIFAEIIVLLGAIYLGVRLGGIAIGYAGGLGVVALTLLGLKAGNIPWDVILIIMSVIAEPCIYAYECYSAHKKRNLQ